MRYVLGFDGGGTKTDCVLMDESGAILARSRSGPSNPYRIGAERALASLQAAALDAFTRVAPDSLPDHTVAPGSFSAVVAGLAGARQPEIAEKMRFWLEKGFPGAQVKLCTDLELALHATGEGSAIVLVAGTGSAAIGRDACGRVVQAGGYGPHLGDDGSAYDIGRRAIRAALCALDQTGRDSALGRQILLQLGCAGWPAVQQRASTSADEVFPRVFPVVSAAADAGDNTARMLLADAARELLSLVKTVADRLGLGNVDFLFTKTGGVFERSTFFEATLDDLLRETAPSARIVALPMTLAEAAARLALRLISTAELAGN
jgi:N-acetylglucosamine kinase-like BadF-type ATPase